MRLLLADLHGGRPLRSGRGIASETPALRDFISGPWKTACYDRYKESTKPFVNYALKRKILPAFGSLAIDRIDKADVVRWFTKYSRKSPGGANKALGLLHDMIRRSPPACSKIPRPVSEECGPYIEPASCR